MELQDLKNLHEKEEPAKGINISEVIMPYVHRWKQFVITFVICLALGVAYYLVTPRSYMVTSAIKLAEQSESGGLGAIASQMSSFNFFSGGGTNIDNDLAAFRSKTLQKEVIMALNLYVTYKGYEGLKFQDIYTESPYRIDIANLEKADELEGVIEFKFKKEAGSYVMTFDDNGTQKSIKIEKPVQEVSTEKVGNIIVSKRTSTVWSTDFSAILKAPRLAAIDFNEIVDVSTTTKSSSIVVLSLPTENIKKAKDFSTALLGRYNEFTEKEKRTEANATYQFVKERLDTISRDLFLLEKEVQDYKVKNKILDLGLEAKASIEQNVGAQVKLSEIEIQKTQLEFIDDYLSKNSNTETMIPTLGISDEGLLVMIASHNNLVVNFQDLKSRASSSNESYRNMQEQLKNSANAIRESIKSLQEGINVTVENFKQIENEYLTLKKKLPLQEREFYMLKRDHEIKETLYLFLIQKSEESVMGLSLGMPKASFIDLPDPGEKHTSPRGSTILMIVIIMTIVLPVGFHIIKDGIKYLRQQ